MTQLPLEKEAFNEKSDSFNKFTGQRSIRNI